MAPGGAESSLPVAVALPAAIVLVGANAFFVAVEFALVKVRPGRLRELAKKGTPGARHALYLVDNLDAALSVCQVGITLASLALGWIGEPAFASILGYFFSPLEPWFGAATLSLSIFSAFLVITFLHVVLGELIPKTLAITSSEKVSIALGLPLRVFWFVIWPLVAGLNWSAQLMLKPFSIEGTTDHSAAHGREELRQLMRASAQQGRIKGVEGGLVENVFRFSDRRAREIMVPRARVAYLDASQTSDEMLESIRDEGFTRYPLVQGDLDRVLGIVHLKDVYKPLLNRETEIDLRRMARRPLVIPESLEVDKLLQVFKRNRAHMAIVADEYGGTAGIVTLEDVLEELVGELRDEFDVEEKDPVRGRPGGGYVLDPLLPIDRSADLVTNPPETPEGVHTVAGYIQAKLGRVPQAGDRVAFGDDHELVATVVHGASVLRVELAPLG